MGACTGAGAEAGEAAEVGEMGDAGDAGEVGDAGKVGKVGNAIGSPRGLDCSAGLAGSKSPAARR
ncbi:MAG: hypothetical protein M3014_00005 [Chloroflexota bacterium]|nr:hypothetical protein [Chloroflexota bacterium]